MNNTGHRTSYPIFMISIALIFDFLKAICSITVILAVVGLALDLLIGAITALWIFTMSGIKGIKDANIKKKVVKRIAGRYFLGVLFGGVPVVNLFPWAAYTVHYTWSNINGKK